MIVYYDAARDLIYAERTQRVWPARSLVALPSATDSTVTVAMATSLVPVLGPLTPDLVQRQDGTAFADQASALAYLQGEFGRFDADTDGFPIVSSTAMTAGIPVAVSRANGQLLPARADAKVFAFVAGVLREDVAAGFATIPSRGAVTLSDWTASTGSSALAAGQPYFLDAAGGLTLSPDRSLVTCIARVGTATSTTTLVVRPFDPLQL